MRAGDNMMLILDERPSDSPFVDTVWRGRAENASLRLAPAGGCWVMLVKSRGHKTRLSVVGPMTKAMPMPCEGDVEFFAIKFKLGTFMPHLPVRNFLNAVIDLPEAASHSFWLNGSTWHFPRYGNVETFMDRLTRKGLLAREGVVDAVLQERPLGLSPRSVQRRFLYATGLTHTSIRQIARARRAMTLLQRGVSILEVVHQAGYADQPHMTKSLKHFIGQTPAQIARLDQSK